MQEIESISGMRVFWEPTMSFVLTDPIGLRAEDPTFGVFVEGRTVSKEQVYYFALHWEERIIAIAARREPIDNARGSGERWLIQRLGGLGARTEPYYFKTEAELQRAIELAVAALKVIPPPLPPPNWRWTLS